MKYNSQKLVKYKLNQISHRFDKWWRDGNADMDWSKQRRFLSNELTKSFDMDKDNLKKFWKCLM